MNPKSKIQNPKSIKFLLLLIALSLFVTFFELGRMDVWSDNEGQRAEPPAEMIRNGDYVIPTMNDKPYLAKPPLLYWTIAGVYKITGKITPFTARIPTALSLVALTLAMYLILRRGLGETAARWAAVGMITSPFVLQQARMAGIDVCLSLAVFLAIMGYWTACNADGLRRKIMGALLGGAAFGAAILLKGPVPFLFLFAALVAQIVVAGSDPEQWIATVWKWTIAAFAIALVLWVVGLIAPGKIRFPIPLVLLSSVCIILALMHNRKPFSPIGVWLAIMAIGIAVAAPWCIAVLHRIGLSEAVRLLQSESIERTHTATKINSGSPFFYIMALPVMLAPWGLLLPCHLSKTAWPQENHVYRFMLLTGWVSVGIFSLIAGKEHKYILPAAPFLLAATGYLIAAYKQKIIESWTQTWLRLWETILPVVFAVLSVGGYIYLVAKLRYPALLGEALVLIAIILALARAAWKRPEARLELIPFMAAFVILTVLVSQSFYYTGKHSFKTIATVTGEILRSGRQVEAVKMTSAFDVFPAFAFYAGIHVPSVQDPARIREKLDQNEPYYCVVRQDLLSKASDANKIQPLLGPVTNKKLILLGNRPIPDLPTGE